ncbi:MAG: response regulator [Bacteroidetes bacterium]|nr:response regulator [Bacteroidota bacterium]
MQKTTTLEFCWLIILQTEGFHVKLCKDGEGALNIFQNERFDLCLFDVMMPVMDGFTSSKGKLNLRIEKFL